MPVAVQVRHAQQVRVLSRDQPTQPLLAMEKRIRAEIDAIQPHKIEGIVTWLASVCHQIVEVRTSFLIQHHNLAIQDCLLPFQTAQNLLKERIKVMELLSLARYQSLLVAVNIQDPAKAVVLQLVDPIRMPDRLLQKGQRRGRNLRQHGGALILSGPDDAETSVWLRRIFAGRGNGELSLSWNGSMQRKAAQTSGGIVMVVIRLSHFRRKP